MLQTLLACDSDGQFADMVGKVAGFFRPVCVPTWVSSRNHEGEESSGPKPKTVVCPLLEKALGRHIGNSKRGRPVSQSQIQEDADAN